uniref:Transposase n=1 Tax=Heterorhabditis bacteriophora TaxID=37862 RepID=A0A1I7W922_HETBA
MTVKKRKLLYGIEIAGQVSQYCPIANEEVSRTDTRAYGRKTSLGQNIHEMRLGKDTTFTSLQKKAY